MCLSRVAASEPMEEHLLLIVVPLWTILQVAQVEVADGRTVGGLWVVVQH